MKHFHFQQIQKSFSNEIGGQVSVIDNLTFSTAEGEITSIIGPSGCGKTTFLRIIAGFEESYSGTVTIEDGNTKATALPVGTVGYIPQEPSLFPWYTVEENVAFSLRLRNVSKVSLQQRVEELLRMVGLEAYRTYYPKELSGGMKQKVTICRALAVPPPFGLLLLDEPFSALDSQTRNALQQDLLSIHTSQHLTLIFVTHNIDEAVFISDQVVVLSQLPARVKNIVTIPLPHPRDRTSPEFNAIRKDLLNLGEFMH
ncbi:MAG: ABC-type nitrate/sulfonate/bicarbonate transport system, ATPase component [Promethearchaeota archaeon CR_4]|nr:MAG: ABC-type nitrate/sulfonate/bicarbonate transport system, ATPase component [Candidatus Lokiarchaeota archaeon CR_4]